MLSNKHGAYFKTWFLFHAFNSSTAAPNTGGRSFDRRRLVVGDRQQQPLWDDVRMNQSTDAEQREQRLLQPVSSPELMNTCGDTPEPMTDRSPDN